MTEHHTSDDPAKLNATDARAAQTGKGVRYMLGASLAGVVILLGIVYLVFLAG